MNLFHVFVLCLLFFAGLWLFGQVRATDAHELAHAQVCKYCGGEPEVSYNSFGLGGQTVCDLKGRTDFCRGGEKAVWDGIIERMGYQQQSYFSVGMFALVLVVFFNFVLALWVVREFKNGH